METWIQVDWSKNSTSIVLKEYPTTTGWTLIIAIPEVKVQGRSPNNGIDIDVPGEILIFLFGNKGTDLGWTLKTWDVIWYTASNWIAAF